jgi:hypothetical protein
MAVLTTFKVKGDPDQLVAFSREKIDPIVEPVARANGRLERIACRTDDGVLVVSLWETLEGSERTAAEVRPKIEELAGADGPRQSDWQSFEVLARDVDQA